MRNDKQKRLRFVREIEPQEPGWLRVALWVSWMALAVVAAWVAFEIFAQAFGR